MRTRDSKPKQRQQTDKSEGKSFFDDFDGFHEQCILSGIKPKDFWKNTVKENILELEYLQAKGKVKWEIARWQSTVYLNSVSKKTIKPTDLFKFSDEMPKAQNYAPINLQAPENAKGLEAINKAFAAQRAKRKK